MNGQISDINPQPEQIGGSTVDVLNCGASCPEVKSPLVHC